MREYQNKGEETQCDPFSQSRDERITILKKTRQTKHT
jgi:hypothetical protein